MRRTIGDSDHDDRGFLAALIGTGRPLLSLTGVMLVAAGAFALFVSATGHFLPHDEAYLGMTAEQLCERHGCRVVHFMFHDRVSFGGALVALGLLYLWLAEFPLRHGEAWAWWLFLLSGAAGFATFLTYLGYGYLDTWHGAATLALLPLFVLGLVRARRAMPERNGPRALLRPGVRVAWATRFGLGRSCLLGTAIGMVGAGLTIMTVGMTAVFVPQDLEFMSVTAAELHELNPRLVPLIAHDRAGFGGAVAVCGLLIFFSVWCARPSRSLWQVLALAGGAGFASAIGVHPAIGYTDAVHLAPAVAGAITYAVGMALCYGPMVRGGTSLAEPSTSREARRAEAASAIR